MKKDNRGMTLVELAVGLAVAGILLAAAGNLLYRNSGQYHSLMDNLSVQTGSRNLSGQLEKWISDADLGISYEEDGVYVLDGNIAGEPESLPEKEQTGEASEKVLTLYSRDSIQIIRWKKDKTISWELQPGTIVKNGDGSSAWFEKKGSPSDTIMLADDIKDFSVNLSEVEKNKIIKLQFTVSASSGREKMMEQSILLRNHVKINLPSEQVYKDAWINEDSLQQIQWNL